MTTTEQRRVFHAFFCGFFLMAMIVDVRVGAGDLLTVFTLSALLINGWLAVT